MNFINDLTPEQKTFCEFWLTRLTRTSSMLTNSDKFHERALLHMLKYEANTRQRLHVINMLHARFSKLRRKREMAEAELWINNTKGNLFPSVKVEYL